jgi:trigger factor
MPYTVTKLPNHTVEITAELPSTTVDEERRKVIQAYRRNARIPGFRPGKAPESAVRARFADEISAELREQLAETAWREVLDGETDLQPLTQPAIEAADLSDDGGFQMTAKLEVRPWLELPDLDGLEISEVDVEPSDAELDEEFDRLREQQAAWEPVDDDARAEDGLLVEADLHGEMEGSDDQPYTEEGARFVLGADGVPAEINEALQGATAGDDRTAERRFPDDDENLDRAGKTVTYRIHVKSLKRKALPDLDDELAKTVGLESLDELRDRVRDAVSRRKEAQRREDWRRAALDHLEANADVNELPSSLVQSAVREDLNRFAYSLAMQGVSPESDDINWQEMAARFEPGARRRVLDNLVLEQLAKTWEIGVPEAEVDAYITGEARQLGVPPGEHKANLAKEDRLGQIRHAARMSATVDELIRRAGGEVK